MIGAVFFEALGEGEVRERPLLDALVGGRLDQLDQQLLDQPHDIRFGDE